MEALALRGNKLLPDNVAAFTSHTYQTILGSAYYRSGDLNKAAETLEQATKHVESPLLENQLYLAMAAQQMGAKKKAEQYLARVTASINPGLPQWLLSLHQEAKELIVPPKKE